MSRTPAPARKLLILKIMSNSTLNLYVKRISLVIGGLIAFAASTRATVIYDGLSFAGGADSIAGFGPLYDSFTSAGSSQIITGLKLKLGGRRGGPGQITVGLFSDSGTSPGALIATLGIINDATITETNVYSLSLFSMPLLAASTRYWIGLSDTGATAWTYPADKFGVGVSGEYFANQQGVGPNIYGAYQMELSVSIPDSGSTACLLGFGVVVLVVMRRSLVNKQALS